MLNCRSIFTHFSLFCHQKHCGEIVRKNEEQNFRRISALFFFWVTLRENKCTEYLKILFVSGNNRPYDKLCLLALSLIFWNSGLDLEKRELNGGGSHHCIALINDSCLQKNLQWSQITQTKRKQVV